MNLRERTINRIEKRLQLAYIFANAVEILMESIKYLSPDMSKAINTQHRGYGAMRRGVESTIIAYEDVFEKQLMEIAKQDNSYAKVLDRYRSDANEAIRTMMRFINHTSTEDDYEKVIELMCSTPSTDMYPEDEIQRFDYRKR